MWPIALFSHFLLIPEMTMREKWCLFKILIVNSWNTTHFSFPLITWIISALFVSFSNQGIAFPYLITPYSTNVTSFPIFSSGVAWITLYSIDTGLIVRKSHLCERWIGIIFYLSLYIFSHHPRLLPPHSPDAINNLLHSPRQW